MIAHELRGLLDELLSQLIVGHQIGERTRSEVPSTDGKQHFDTVGFLQLDGTSVHA